MNKTKKTLIIAVVLVALLVVAGSIIAFAQSGDDGNDPVWTKVNSPAQGGLANRNRPLDRLHRNWPGAANIDYDALLADALGISVEELHDARELANLAALDQAVEEGFITQRRADLTVAARALRSVINRGELVAEALGITLEELQKARQDQAMPALLEELNMTPAEAREAVLAEFGEFVQQAVDDEIISEEQAELILERPGLVLETQQNPQARGGFQGRGVGRGVRPGRGPAPFQGGTRLFTPANGV